MEQDTDFRNYHLYRRLVRRQLVKPLAHECGSEYLSTFSSNYTFNLLCPSCNVQVEPGLNLLKQIESVVKEHFSD